MLWRVEIEDRNGIVATHSVDAPTKWAAKEQEEMKGYRVLSVNAVLDTRL